MENQFEKIGNNLSVENSEQVVGKIEERRKEVLKPLAGEVEKRPSFIDFIKDFNSWLYRELDDLGIEYKGNISPDQVHLLTDDSFKKEFKKRYKMAGSKCAGFHDASSNAVYVKTDIKRQDSDEFARADFYHTNIHEMIHQASYHKYSLENIHEATPEKHIQELTDLEPDIYRMGYAIYGKKPEDHNHFYYLDEAVVEKLSNEMMHEHQWVLYKLAGIHDYAISSATNGWVDRKKQIEYKPGYEKIVNILDLVIKKIAQKKNEPIEDVWRRFKKGLFTGELMHLRDIEKTFGKGSLRFIEQLFTLIQKSNKKEKRKLFPKINAYFEAANDANRKEIEKEILGEYQ